MGERHSVPKEETVPWKRGPTCVTPKGMRSIRSIKVSTSDDCNEPYRTLSRTKPNIQPAWRLETALGGPQEGPAGRERGQDCGWQEMTSLAANHSLIASHPGFGNWAWGHGRSVSPVALSTLPEQRRLGPVQTPPSPGHWAGGGSVALVETRWDRGR